MRALFSRDAGNEHEEEHRYIYPTCDCCGDDITSETLHIIHYGGKDLFVCNYCLGHERETWDFVEEK